MDKLYEMLQNIHKRPNLYLGKPSLERLAGVIDGFIMCMHYVNGQKDFQFFPGFQEFIQEKYNIKTTQNWVNIIQFHCFSEEEAFEKFYNLLDEFLETID